MSEFIDARTADLKNRLSPLIGQLEATLQAALVADAEAEAAALSRAESAEAVNLRAEAELDALVQELAATRPAYDTKLELLHSLGSDDGVLQEETEVLGRRLLALEREIQGRRHRAVPHCDPLPWHSPSTFQTQRSLRAPQIRATLGSYRLWQEQFTEAYYQAVFEHADTLLRMWRKHVRPGTFTGIRYGEFPKVWQEFEDEILRPALRRALGEIDVLPSPLFGLIEQERPSAFSYLASRATTNGTTTAELSPTEYELMCADLLSGAGWKAQTTVASGDQGVDVYAVRGQVSLVLQCKLYTKPVGNRAVQEAVAARGHEHAHFAAVVATSGFTSGAEELARTNGVALLHHSELVAWANGLLGIG